MSELERKTLAYLWRYGLFLKFSQSNQWFNNSAISTFLHSTPVDLPSSYLDHYLNKIKLFAMRWAPFRFWCLLKGYFKKTDHNFSQKGGAQAPPGPSPRSASATWQKMQMYNKKIVPQFKVTFQTTTGTSELWVAFT